jgi:CHASE2 domain-containing sensor protein
MKASWFKFENIGFMAIAIIMVTAMILGLRQMGKWQYWELLAFDQIIQSRPDAPPDDRFLVVTITEEDIRQQQDWPVSDRILAQLLNNLQKHQPQTIGLDIYRDFPRQPGYEDLVKELQQPNVFVVRNIDTFTGTPAPSASPKEQIGFNDIPQDPDGVVRRNLLFAETNEGETLYSFALLIAIDYLQTQEIYPQPSEKNPNHLQLGSATFVPLLPHTGGYQNIESKGYQILANFRNRYNPAPTVTLSQVLAAEVDPQLIKGKIVLIGSQAISLRDTFLTPYTKAGSKTSGVMLHVDFISQFLDAATGKRRLFWYWTTTQESIWIIGWIIAGGIMGFIFRHPVAVFLGSGLGAIIILTIGLIMFFNGGWIPIATPLIGFIISIGTVVTYQSYQDHQKQQIVMKLLGQNTSPEIATALWEQRETLLTSGKLPGISLTATLLFLDIKGFSTISEIMNPQNLLEWLNHSLEKIAHEIINYKGVINKFTGDGLMAVFGVPIPRKNRKEIARDAQNCVSCALAIAKYLDILNYQCQQKNLPLMQMRIGIYTGEVVAGSLGGKDRIEYGVIGDTVNIASRLESCDKDNQPCDCRILIGKETLDYLEGKFKVESWGEKELKGKKQMVSVYRVIDSL